MTTKSKPKKSVGIFLGWVYGSSHPKGQAGGGEGGSATKHPLKKKKKNPLFYFFEFCCDDLNHIKVVG